MNLPILSILILLPMVGVALIMMLNRENQWVIKGTAMAVALAGIPHFTAFVVRFQQRNCRHAICGAV